MIRADEVVPGDVVLLGVKDLYVGQAALTGETFPVEKTPYPVSAGASLSERTNVVFMGTSIRSGNGKALIVVTGKGTAFGQIAERLRLRPQKTSSSVASDNWAISLGAWDEIGLDWCEIGPFSIWQPFADRA